PASATILPSVVKTVLPRTAPTAPPMIPATAPRPARLMAILNCLPVIDSRLHRNPPINRPARAPSNASVSRPPVEPDDTLRMNAHAAEPPNAPVRAYSSIFDSPNMVASLEMAKAESREGVKLIQEPYLLHHDRAFLPSYLLNLRTFVIHHA